MAFVSIESLYSRVICYYIENLKSNEGNIPPLKSQLGNLGQFGDAQTAPFIQKASTKHQLSSVQNPYDIPLNPGWLIGILIMAHYNPYITG